MRSSGLNRWRLFGIDLRGVALGTALSMSASVATVPALALGLGEIDTRSALNERFAAEIELLDTRGLEAGEVLASLASTDDFRRVGVERFFFLTSLQFEVNRNARGNLVIQATSQQPITEPYLNFLVEVLWPSGRLLKEYTVLLDPPTFTHSTAAPVAAPQREQTDVASAGRIQREQPVAETGRVALPSPSAPRVSTPVPQVASNDGTYGRTTRTDTMWTIANQTLPSGAVTPQQNMLAIQEMNPTAFIDGNINLLKAGVVLRLPSESEAQSISNSSAIAEIDRQNKAWRAGSPGRAVASSDAAEQGAAEQASASPIDATSRGPGETGSAAASGSGTLRIVAATETGGVSDAIENSGTNESGAVVGGDPASTERLEELSREVESLTYQLDLQKRGVEEQISTREKQISLKDQQIAQLQEQLKNMRESAQAGQPQDQSTPQASSEATPFWQQPMVLGGALAALMLGLGGLFLARRRNAVNDDLDFDELDHGEPSYELAPSAAGTATPLADADLIGDLAEADLALGVAVEAEQDAELGAELGTALDDDDDLFGPADDADTGPVAAGDAPQTSDVIGEADIYIAYGRYPQAIALLEGAVETNPADHAVRMRLLEVSAETKDAEGYAQQLAALRAHCSDADVLAGADSLHSSLDADFREQAEAQAPAESASGAGLVAGAGAALAAGAASVLGSDSPDLQDDVQDSLEAEPFAFDTTVADDDGGFADLSLDDEQQTGEFGAVDLDQLSEESVPDAVAEVETEFELDLDSDLGTDLDVSADTEIEFATPAADSEFDLDAAVESAATESAAAESVDVPSVDTDQFATNVDIAASADEAAAVDDFELDLDPVAVDEDVDFSLDAELDTDALAASSADDVLAVIDSSDSLGGDLGMDFPDSTDNIDSTDTTELAQVVAETDDDQLLDEIERSLDELEADGLLTPELSEEGDFSFDDDADTSATKLDLARAYIDMGDDDGAREILGEVLTEGDNGQKGEANELLNKL